MESHRGYLAIPAPSLEPLTWTLSPEEDGVGVLLRHRTGIVLRFVAGSPLVDWDGTLLQMVDSPYWVGETFYLPLQVVTDLFPGFLPGAYRFDESSGRLEVEGAIAAASGPSGTGILDRESTSPGVSGDPPSAPVDAEPSASRIVIIDPGHGGDDPGATGDGGIREKDVALSIALALHRALSGDPDLEVRLTRDRDQLVPLWERGELATAWKGDRPGVFISIHANALPDRTGVRGFETYFLSEARTEHERRVAAAENAAMSSERQAAVPTADPLLGGILADLRTFDHQHWSALLAEEVQRELGTFHPGPDRGVKQGPLAVITNSLMPSVLVEIGFITNPREARDLIRTEFQADAAAAIARAVGRFFERYPPGETP
ncbi:MAG: N-acetylmuramoyl-L-alanine amidase [Gemmatimonadota bacterium]